MMMRSVMLDGDENLTDGARGSDCPRQLIIRRHMLRRCVLTQLQGLKFSTLYYCVIKALGVHPHTALQQTVLHHHIISYAEKRNILFWVLRAAHPSLHFKHNTAISYIAFMVQHYIMAAQCTKVGRDHIQLHRQLGTWELSAWHPPPPTSPQQSPPTPQLAPDFPMPSTTIASSDKGVARGLDEDAAFTF